MGHDHDEDGYGGPAETGDGDSTVAVTVRLRGHFDPISGWYNWYGRVAASSDVERFGAAPFEVLDTLPDREA